MISLTGFMSFVTAHTMLIGILVVGIFLVYIFYLRPKMNKQNTEVQSEKVKEVVPAVSENKQPNVTTEKPESAAKRMARGFKVMGQKIRDSEYVKNMQAEQETAKFDDMMPRTLFGDKSDGEDDIDPFATDFSKIGRVGI